MLARTIIAFLCCSMSALAQHIDVQPLPTSVAIAISELRLAVRAEGGRTERIALAHANADRSLDSLRPLDVLRWTVALPNRSRPVATLQVDSWIRVADRHIPPTDASINVGAVGSFGDAPMAVITFQPWKVEKGIVYIADNARILIDFDEPLRPSDTPLAAPQYLPALVNPLFVPSSRRSKTYERTQGDVDPSSWYDPSRPYVRLTTKRDGIAAALASEIIGVSSRLLGLPLAAIVMWHNGAQVPIAISDGDGSGTFNAADTIWWQSRRPRGDSTWFSTWDTTSIFYVSSIDGSSAARLSPWPDVRPTLSMDRLLLNRHVEYDTGHYHLGNASEAIYGVFNSEVVDGEGFYWATLNATGYQRMRHQEVITPHPMGSVSIDISYVTVNDPPFTPVHRFDASADGATTTSIESGGYEHRVLHIERRGTEYVSGPMSVKLFATGIDSLRKYRDYQSEAVVDHMTFTGDVLPFLYEGALHAAVPPHTTDIQIPLSGMRTATYLVMDTTNRSLSKRVATERGVIMRAGIAPVDAEWPTTAWDGRQRRVVMMIDDSIMTWDTTTGFVAVARQPSGLITSTETADAETFAQWLRAQSTGTVVIAASTTTDISDGLRSALIDRGVTAPSSTTWLIGFVAGETGSAKLVSASGPESRASLSHQWSFANGSIWFDALPIAAADSTHELFIHDADDVEFVRPSAASLRALSSLPPIQTDVIYITHSIHRAQTERLAKHRRDWNGVSTAMYDVNEIMEEYGAGNHTPHGIRAFLRDLWMKAPAPKPKYLVLVGNASWDVRLAIKAGNVGARRPDQIPTYGRPSADYWYGLLDDPTDYGMPELIVGRIPALTADETSNLIDKIITHDTIPFAPWMRRFFFIGGGEEDEGLCNIYQDLLNDPFGSGYTLTGVPLCIDTVTLCNYPKRPNTGFAVKQTLNEGVEWMNFIGHGATDQFDIRGWDPNELDNAGRTGFFATYACQTGAYSNPSTPCKNAQYLTEPGRGLVGAVGGTGWTFKVTAANLHYRFHDAMRSYGLRAFGDIVYHGKTILAQNGDQDGINTVMQQCLLGDPLSRIRIDTLTDLFVRGQDVDAVDRTGEGQLTEDDSLIIIRIRVRNTGIGTSVPVVVRLRRSFDGVTDSTETILEDGLCADAIAKCTLYVKGMVGEHIVNIEVDPDRLLPADPHQNNAVQFVLGIYTNALLPVEPQAHWSISATQAVARMLDPNRDDPSAQAEFFLSTRRDTADKDLIVRSTPDDVTRSGSVIDWRIGVELPIEANLWLGARRREQDLSRVTSIQWLPIRTSDVPSSVVQEAIIPAQRITPLTSSVVFDSISQTVRLARRNIDIFLRSSGIQTSDILRQPILQMYIGGVPFVENPYYRGLNVIVLGPLDTIPRAIRRYDTWQDPVPAAEGGHDGYSHEFLTFVRDSVGDDERLIIASCDEAFTGFVKDTTLDSLRDVMRSFGSIGVDSLRPQASWVFIGRRGTPPGQAWERWKNAPDSMVTLSMTLPFYAREGSMITPFVGPAKRWTTVDVDGRAGTNGLTSYIIGRSADGDQRVLDTLKNGVGQWRPADGADQYPFVAVISDLRFVADDSTAPAVGYVRSTFVPADEWLIEPSDVALSTAEPLRGDTIRASFRVRNAFRSFASDSIGGQLSTIVTSSSERPVVIPWYIQRPIAPDEIVEVTELIPTARLTTATTIETKVNDQGRRELYGINNSGSTALRLREDTSPPRLEVMIDNVDVTDGMYVLRTPVMKIILHDNSSLPIGDSTRLTTFINGDRIKSSNTSDFLFAPTEAIRILSGDADARAGMRFTYPLELGQNNVIVRGQDATGNGDTLEFSVYTTDKTSIQDVSVAPNPVSGSATFLVDLRTDMSEVPGSIQIYGLGGEQIRTIPTSLVLGRTAVTWDGLDDTGSVLPIGLYHVRFVADDPSGPSARITRFVVYR